MIGAAVAAVHSLPLGAAEGLDAFHDLLCRWNERMDLTAVTSPEEALHAHYLDSLSALSLLPSGARVVDVGAGAGFPGIPLALARPDLSMILLDARQKRVAFLQEAIARLFPPSRDIRAVHGRAEAFALGERETFDAALCRAVAPLPVVLEWALPLVIPGGRCIAWKGPAAALELNQARRAAPLLGGGPPQTLDAPGLGPGFRRVLILVEKQSPTDPRFPRRPGMARKRPL